MDQLNEYGGYLPLELPLRNHYYFGDRNQIRKYNSGLTALYCALVAIKPERVFLPYYICHTVEELISKMEINICHYHINSSFEPLNVNPNNNDCVVLVNYYGICGQVVKEYQQKYPLVIIDNTQAFFSEPIYRDGAYNIYSTRKFFGVADGGYLIGKQLQTIDLPQDYSAMRASFLMKQYETGVNSSYSDYLKSNSIVEKERKEMSVLTDRILASIDYERIKKQRNENFQYFHSLVKELNRHDLDNCMKESPYLYPLLLNIDIRKELIAQRVYVPTLWKENIVEPYKDWVEYDLSAKTLFLPIDQRYNKCDLNQIFQRIKTILEK